MFKKILPIIFLFFILSFFLISFPQKVSAALTECQTTINKCPVCTPTLTSIPETDPLNSSSRKAKISIPLAGEAVGYKSYSVRFDCGASYHRIRPITPTGNTLNFELDKTGWQIGAPCEFSAGPHNMVVTAYENNREGSILCRAPYTIADAYAKCDLTITPTTGITTATKLKYKINAQGTYYYAYLDDVLLNESNGRGGSLPWDALAGWHEQEIPTEYMTPGKHSLVISTKRFGKDPSTTACSASFEVGTPSAPGGVTIRPPTGVGTSAGVGLNVVPPGLPAFSGKEDVFCDGEKGIKTAIGCVRTSPVAFVEDFIKFITAVAGGLAFLMMLLGAFGMLRSAGNPDSLQAGRDRFTSGVIGLLFVIFAVLIMQIIGIGVLNIPGFTTK